MRMVVIFALALLCAPAGLFGQALHPDSLFPRLIGRWVLRGTIARQQTVHDVTFEWLLGREYVQVHEVSRERAPQWHAGGLGLLIGHSVPIWSHAP